MNMIKKNGGFTLVELIVVIAILAILAGVAAPAYSGYISKANEAADYTMLDSVKTAAVFETMDADHNATVTKLVVEEGSTTVDVTYTIPGETAGTIETKTMRVDVKDYVAAIDFKSNNEKATWCASDDTDTTDVDEEGWILSK